MKPLSLLNRAVVLIEGAVAALLLVLAVLGVIDILITMFEAASAEGFITPEGITRTIDTVLVVFIVIELIRIAVAYMQHKNVIGTVLEAGLVAVVRKIVIFEGGSNALSDALALSALILAVGVAWYLLRRAGVSDCDTIKPE